MIEENKEEGIQEKMKVLIEKINKIENEEEKEKITKEFLEKIEKTKKEKSKKMKEIEEYLSEQDNRMKATKGYEKRNKF